jgi:Na+-translocating ferredoxin:NAD+ oxidoreductase RnfC subunit
MLLEQIRAAGVVGAGGAGFPTAAKLNAQAEYLIINAAECEPLLKTDHYVMNHFAEECVTAIVHMGEMLNAREVIIATKRYYTEEIAALRAAIEHQKAAITIFEMDNFYPAGDEQTMVFEVTGRTVPPGGIPLAVGCVVSNISTTLNIYHAELGEAVTQKYLTVTGAVRKPTILHVPLGTSFAECLALAGGTPLDDYIFINGGPMMGQLGSKETFDQQVVTKTTSGIIILEKKDMLGELFDITDEQFLNTARQSCIQCQLCTELCPRYQIGHPIHPHRIMRHLALTDVPADIDDDPIWQEALLCCECGICEVIACPMGLMPRQVNKYVKKVLREKGIRYQHKDRELVVDEMREYKKVPPKNIILKDGLQQYADFSITECIDYTPEKVAIPMRMHIGAPAIASVTVGQQVARGDLIAAPKEGALGANIHASITGVVTAVTDNSVEIEGGTQS